MSTVSEILATAGAVAVIAAVVGGGLSAAGFTIPVLDKKRRQFALFLVGVILIILAIMFSDPAPRPEPRPPIPPSGQIGFTYYGRKDNGQPSDGGKLRPANGAPLPVPEAIREGDVFKGVDVKQLRERDTTDSAAVGEFPIGTCYRTIDIREIKAFAGGSGVWLQVQVVRCPS